MPLLVYIGLVGLFIFSLYIQQNPEKVYKYSNQIGEKENELNTFCQEYETYNSYKNDDTLIYKNFLDTYFLNKMSCIWMKKQHAFWIWADGLAIDQLKNFFSETSKQSTVMGVYPPSDKESAIIHDIYMTGQQELNRKATPVKQDNIFKQMKQAGQQKLKYIGKVYPIDRLAHQYFSNATLESGADKIYFDKICQEQNLVTDLSEFNSEDSDWKKYGDSYWVGWKEHEMEDIMDKKFVNLQLTNEKWKQCLDQNEIYGQQNSLIYYTSIPDHHNHAWGKASLKTYYFTYRFQKQLLSLRKFLMEEHPDIPLIISSDHGGQARLGDDMVAGHGDRSETNRAILYITMDYLKNSRGTQAQIHHLDFASTSALIFSNVNIPLMSQGTPQSIFSDDFNVFLVAFSHFNQLKQYVTVLKSYYDKNEIDSAVESLNLDKIEKEIKEYNDNLLRKIKFSDFFDENMRSIANDNNIRALNQIECKNLTKKLKEKNEQLQQITVSFTYKYKKFMVFYILILLSSLIVILYCAANKKIVLDLFFICKIDNCVEKLQWILAFLIFISDLIFWLFSLKYDDRVLEVSNYFYLVLKFLLIISLPTEQKTIQYKESHIEEMVEVQNELDSQQIYKDLSRQNDIFSGGIIKSDNENDDYEEVKFDNPNTEQNLPIQISQQSLINSEQFYIKAPKEVQLFDRYIINKVKSKIPQLNKLKMALIVSFIISIIALLMHQYDIYMSIKVHEEVFAPFYWFIMIIVYGIFYMIMVKDSEQVLHSKYIEQPRWRILKNIELWLFRILVFVMCMYDLDDHHRRKIMIDFIVNSIITFSLLFAFFYKAFSANIPQDVLNSGGKNHHLLSAVKLLGITYIFYLEAITEKIFILVIVIPVLQLFLATIRHNSLSLKYKIIALMCLIREAGLIFTLIGGSFQLGLNQAIYFKLVYKRWNQNPTLSYIYLDITKIKIYIIIFLGIFSLMIFKRTQKWSIITFDYFGRIVNFILVFKALLTGLVMYIVLYITQAEGLYFLRASKYFAGHVLIIAVVLIPLVIILQLRYLWFLNNEKSQISSSIKQIAFIGMYTILLAYLFITDPFGYI